MTNHCGVAPLCECKNNNKSLIVQIYVYMPADIAVKHYLCNGKSSYKNKMKKIFGAMCALFALAVASCTPSNDGETIQEQTFPSCFVYVTDLQDGTITHYNQVGYKLKINYTTQKGELTVSNLKLPDGTTYPAMTLKNLSLANDKEGWLMAMGKSVNPEMTGVGTKPVFENVELRLLGRIVESSYVPAMLTQFTVNSRYKVASSFTGQFFFGKTKSVPVDGSSQPFETEGSTYMLNFDIEKQTLKMTINNAKFMDRMPDGMNIVLKDIPFMFAGTTAQWSVASITPELANVPQPNFPITNLVGVLDFTSGMKLSFVCAPVIKNQPLGEFNVNADCKYTFIPGASYQ